MHVVVKDVSFSYVEGIKVLKGINVDIDNQSVAIIGQNGAGKTTFIKLLNNMLPLSSGEILIDGVSVSSKPLNQWSQSIGFVFQNPKDQLFNETVFKEIEFGLLHQVRDAKQREEKVKQIAAKVGIEHLLEEHPLEIPFSQQKLVTLGTALVNDPQLVLLDEPTANQDWLEVEHFMKVINSLQQQGIQFITISHDMNFVTNTFNRILIFGQGQLLSDTANFAAFDDQAVLAQSHIVAPPVVQVAKQMKMKGTPLNLNEFERELLAEL
ncbi:energy-coupling factor ABC transporter ATP-binding protein [Vibrio rhodolitus]|uniref:energy-coupling factor ABC transporter ATP-binding protein n=1 Tax=Vibrio rhodolitus TaxID=2231649 RepID=UPI000E0A6469|nr:ABC transporter ATP-binding protein [Vibrio rhodolitus]